MIKTPLSLIRVAAFCLPLALVSSCGAESAQGTVININPNAWNQQTVAGGSACSGVNQYRIEARSPNGVPQVGVQLLIDSPNGYLVYDGFLTPTAAACGETITGATPKVYPYYATTDSTGTYSVTVVFSWTGGQNATATAIGVYSGTSYGKTDIVFKCVATLPQVCPT